jgi:CBS domain containing-hemolysin-like protein
VSGGLVITLLLKAVVALGLVGMNAFFVAAELALVKIRDTQIDTLVAQGNRAATVARRLKSNINAAISTVQIGITLAGLLSGYFVEPLVQSALDPVLRMLEIHHIVWVHQAVSIASFVGMTFTLIVVGEMVPKAIALKETVPVVLFVARPLGWFHLAAYPLIRGIDGTSRWILRHLGVESLEEEVHSSEAHRRERGSELGREIVLNSLDLRHRVVAQVMRPRREITVLDTREPIEACLECAERSRYSRLPLCEDGDLDRAVGVVHVKDLYSLRTRARTGEDLRPVARRLIYLPETTRLERLLQLFLERRLHFALVVDEYGSTTGMVTLENVLEELVGQIQDEFDHEKPRVTRRGEDAWELDASLPLFELVELTGVPLESEGTTTINGWITQRLGRFPNRTDRIPMGGFELSVEELDGVRVSRVGLRRVGESPPS